MTDIITTLLDPVFGPIANLNPTIAIAIFATIVSLISSLIYKLVTDQTKLKSIKEKQKKYQEEIKLAKDDPDKALKLQQKAMKLSMEYMNHSLKATMYTFIPLILIFTWLRAHMAYDPLMADQPFMIELTLDENIQDMPELLIYPEGKLDIISSSRSEAGTYMFELKGPNGEYEIYAMSAGETSKVAVDVIITDKQKYAPVIQEFTDDFVISAKLNNSKIMPLSFIGLKWGWLGGYILFSLGIGTLIRKLLKIS